MPAGPKLAISGGDQPNTYSIEIEQTSGVTPLFVTERGVTSLIAALVKLNAVAPINTLKWEKKPPEANRYEFKIDSRNGADWEEINVLDQTDISIEAVSGGAWRISHLDLIHAVRLEIISLAQTRAVVGVKATF